MKALIVVDAQNDFFEGGALEVPNSNVIIPNLNLLIAKFDLVYFTQDWHPLVHKSFATQYADKNVYDLVDLQGLQQVLWPEHCVQGTVGAEFKPEVAFDKEQHSVVYKGTNAEIDSYSGFFDNDKKHSTELHNLLQYKGVTELVICGLAADYCVKFTALDAQALGYTTTFVTDATAAVNLRPTDYDKTLVELREAGVHLLLSKDV